MIEIRRAGVVFKYFGLARTHLMGFTRRMARILNLGFIKLLALA